MMFDLTSTGNYGDQFHSGEGKGHTMHDSIEASRCLAYAYMHMPDI